KNSIAALREPAAADLMPDVAVYTKAVEYLLRYPEQYYQPRYFADALALADEGLRRARELAAGGHAWTIQAGFVARGYRSAVDGSVQPYAVYVPPTYRAGTPMRLDVILHG